MKFRTEIETPARIVHEISHNSTILMLGSCFTDNIGRILQQDGFDVVHNPMGPLYNPLSLLRALNLAAAAEEPSYTLHQGAWHCLDFASRYSANSLPQLQSMVSADIAALATALERADTVIITLGTSFVYYKEGEVVGNCHKLPPGVFTRRMISPDECIDALSSIVSMLQGKTVIFTVSPIRHVADTLHGNQVSKSNLLTSLYAVMSANPSVMYFPAYEILIDDLRDYRFYAADLNHPSETAVQYIYEVFAKHYFTNSTIEKARLCRKQAKRLAHIPILKDATQS